MTDSWQTVGKHHGPNISLIINYSIELDNSIVAEQSNNDTNIYNICILSSQWISLTYIKNIHYKLFNMDIGYISNLKRNLINDNWQTTWTRLGDAENTLDVNLSK